MPATKKNCKRNEKKNKLWREKCENLENLEGNDKIMGGGKITKKRINLENLECCEIKNQKSCDF